MSKSKLSDRIGAFTTIPNTVIALIPKIGVDAMILFLYLRFRTNSESEIAFPNYDTICDDTTLTRRRIALAIRSLEQAGLLERKRRFSASTIYALKMPDAPISTPPGLVEESPLVHPLDCISTPPGLPLVQQLHTNKTDLNKIKPNKTDPIGKKPRRKKETPETDPRSSSSEIQLFREVTGRYPCLEQYDLVIECVHGRTLEQLKPYWQEWHIVRHYRADNIAWLTDWVKQGHMPNGNGNGNGRKDGTQESNAFAALRLARERREAKANGNA